MAALNIVGGFIIKLVNVPIFLDMIGTMVVSVALVRSVNAPVLGARLPIGVLLIEPPLMTALAVVSEPATFTAPPKLIGSVIFASNADGRTCESVPSPFATTTRSLMPSDAPAVLPSAAMPTRPSANTVIRSRKRLTYIEAQAVVDGASRIAGELDAKLFVVASKSGLTAIARSKRRGAVPTVGVSDNPATLRQMALYWGVTPLAGATATDTLALLDHVCTWGLREGRLQRGDRILLVAGSGFGTGGHNMALVHEV